MTEAARSFTGNLTDDPELPRPASDPASAKLE
jgi:hypothetical protein